MRRIFDKLAMVVLGLAVLAGLGIYGSDFMLKWRARGGLPLMNEAVYIIKVTDPDGRPVSGARVAAGVAGFGSAREYYWWGRGDRVRIFTDDNGVARIPASLLNTGMIEPGAALPLYVVHEDRGLVALVALRSQPTDTTISVDLVPGCNVTVTARGDFGAFRSRDMNAGLYVKWGLAPSVPILQGAFQTRGLLPPGNYLVDAINSFTTTATQTLEVPIGQKQLFYRAEPDDDAGTRLAGEPTPELEDVRAWSGSPVSLEDLRGHVVLLYIWNRSNPSAAQELFFLARVQRRHYSSGLRIVAIHDSSIESKREFDTMLRRLSEDMFEGLPVPITVGLDSDDIFELEDGTKAYGRNTAVFGGVQTLLIDRKGIIRRRVDLAQQQQVIGHVYSMLAGDSPGDGSGDAAATGQKTNPPPEPQATPLIPARPGFMRPRN